LARFIDQIEDYIKQLQSTGLDDAPIFFNDFQTMTVGGLLEGDMVQVSGLRLGEVKRIEKREGNPCRT